MTRLLDFLFACRHNRYTFPQSSRGSHDTTVSCLECGAQLNYDWQAMKVTGPVTPCGVLIPCPVAKARKETLNVVGF